MKSEDIPEEMRNPQAYVALTYTRSTPIIYHAWREDGRTHSLVINCGVGQPVNVLVPLERAQQSSWKYKACRRCYYHDRSIYVVDRTKR